MGLGPPAREEAVARGRGYAPRQSRRLREGSPREVGKGSEKLGNLRDAQGGLEREGSASFRAAAGGRSLKGLSTGLPLWLVVLVVRSGDPIDRSLTEI